VAYAVARTPVHYVAVTVAKLTKGRQAVSL